MRRRIGALMLALLASGSTCKRKDGATGRGDAKPEAQKKFEAHRERPRELDVVSYRLAPDRRIDLAAKEMARLIGKDPLPTVTFTFTDGRWMIPNQRTTLSELPTYEEMLALLVELARPWTGKPAHTGAAGDRKETGTGDELLPYKEAWKVLTGLDTMPGPLTPERIHRAAVATASILFVTVDTLEVGDVLAARTLALLALDKLNATGDAATALEEALLAHALGFTKVATEKAQLLPPTSALRSFLLHDDKALAAQAEKALKTGSSRPAIAPMTSMARYLWLRRLVENNDDALTKQWLRKAQKQGSTVDDAIATFTALIAESDFDIRLALPTFAVAALPAIKSKKGGEAQEAPPNLPATTDELEPMPFADVVLAFTDWPGETAMRPGTEAKLASPMLERAFVDSLFGSTMAAVGEHFLFNFASLDSARNVSKVLAASPAASAKALGVWYDELIAARAGTPVQTTLIGRMRAPGALGGMAVLKIFTAYADHASWADRTLLRMVEAALPHLDARPPHQDIMSTLAWDGLSDLPLYERYARAELRDRPTSDLRALAAMRDLRFDEVAAMLENAVRNATAQGGSPGGSGSSVAGVVAAGPGLSRYRQVELIFFLHEHDKISLDAVSAKLDRVLDLSEDDWRGRAEAVKRLRKLGQSEKAKALVTAWMAKYSDGSRDFHEIYAATALSRIHFDAGQYDEGWKAIAPYLPSYQWGALSLGALNALGLGKADEAEAIGQKMLKRYPGTKSAAFLAELYWRMGKYDEAAAVLAEHNQSITPTDWHFAVGDRFADVFGKKPVGDGLAAFGALAALKLDPLALRALSAAANRAKAHELAFSIASEIRMPGMAQLECMVWAYDFLKAWKGEAEAMAWLKPQLPAGRMVEPLCLFAFAHRDDELFSLIAPAPTCDDKSESVRLFSAASALRSRAKQKLATLKKAYEATGCTYYHDIGRVLVGLAPPESLFPLTSDGKKAVEVAYYLGFFEEMNGNYAAASDYYRAVLAKGGDRDFEYKWAFEALDDWKTSNMSLAALARARTSGPVQ